MSEFPLIREYFKSEFRFPLYFKFNSRGVELEVEEGDQPGDEETSPANSQHDTDVVRGQFFIAVDILDLHSFSDI